MCSERNNYCFDDIIIAKYRTDQISENDKIFSVIIEFSSSTFQIGFVSVKLGICVYCKRNEI